MSDHQQGTEPPTGGKQRELWAAVKRFMASHPEARQTDAFAHVAELYGRSASGVGSAFYRIEREEQGLPPYRRASDRDGGDEDEGGYRRLNASSVPRSYRTLVTTIRRQLAVIERAAQAIGENLTELERAMADEAAEAEADRERLAELETVISRLQGLLPKPDTGEDRG